MRMSPGILLALFIPAQVSALLTELDESLSAAVSLWSMGTSGAELSQCKNVKVSCSIPLNVSLLRVPGVTLKEDYVSTVGTSKIAVGTLLIPDGANNSKTMGANGRGPNGKYPEWASVLTRNTSQQAERYGHSHIIRMLQAPMPERLLPKCKDPQSKVCFFAERDNINWEKYRLVWDYFSKENPYDYVLMLDADASFIQPNLDSLRIMADILRDSGKDFLFADEDWKSKTMVGYEYINGGMMLARRTPYTMGLLRFILDSYQNGIEGTGCASNEQICFRGLLKTPKALRKYTFPGNDGRPLTEHLKVLSGMEWNRHPCTLPYWKKGCVGSFPHEEAKGPTHIMHFMGGSKGSVYNEGIYEDVPIV